MKRVYCTPDAKLVVMVSEDILTGSLNFIAGGNGDEEGDYLENLFKL